MELEVPAGWIQSRFHDVFVFRDKSVPLIEISSADSTVSAICLGWIAYKSRFYDASSESEVIVLEESLDVAYREFTGRFVLLSKEETGYTVWTDAGAMLPAVCNREGTIVASSPIIAAWPQKPEPHVEAIKAARNVDGSTWYPFGLTPFEDYTRLLPHRKFQLGRNDTTVIPFERDAASSSAQKVVRRIFEAGVDFIDALSRSAPISAHLTAGFDSRMVLACCLASDTDPKFITIDSQTAGSMLDAGIAKYLANDFNLDHEVQSLLSATANQKSAWYERTSDCIKDTVVDLCRTVEENDKNRYTLTGASGEVGRAFYWTKDDIGAFGLDSKDLVSRLGFKHSGLLLSLAEQWIAENQGGRTRPELLDLAYIDLRIGCWSGPSVLGHNISKPTLSPFNSLSTYCQMSSLTENCRAKDRFPELLIACQNEDLSRIPFNRPIGPMKFTLWRQELKYLLPNWCISALKGLRSKSLDSQ